MSHSTDQSAPSAQSAARDAVPASEPSRQAVDIRRLPGVRPLAADYTSNFGAVRSFFAGDPADPQAWRDAVTRVQAHRRDRDATAAVLAAQLERRGAPPAARAAAARLADPQSVAIVTGQQAGLFGGPLFTLLKALTAIALARRLETTEGVAAVPVFWIDAEDHDWNEVRGCTVLDEALTARRIALPESAAAAQPVGHVVLDEGIVAAIDELERTLPDTEFRGEVTGALRAAYTPGASMADAFGRWLEHVLGPRGLVVYDASDPAAKPLARTVFVRELSTAGTTGALAARAGAALEAAGYHAQVQAGADGVALFRLDGGRQPMRRRGTSWVAGDREFAAADLVREAEGDPGRFSPNVLLRPIVQDAIFPTVCYVAGPSELAYLSQLREVYAHFGVPMPLVHPRASLTLVDAAAMRFLGKYELPLEALQPQDEAALNELLARQMPPEVDESFTRARAEIAARMLRIIEVVPTVDATLEGTARSTLKRMEHDLDTLHGKLVQAAKRRDDTLRRQFTRTRALAFPDGKAQERAIGFVWFLNQYGQALVERLDATLPLDPGRHWVLTI